MESLPISKYKICTVI